MFDNFETNVRVAQNAIVRPSIWDWFGYEEYVRIRPLSYPGTNVFLLLFPVNSSPHLKDIANEYLPEIRQHKPDAFLLLVGTKSDLRADAKQKQWMQERKRCFVTKSQAKYFAKQMHCTAYIETSALSGTNMQEAMDIMCKLSIMTPQQLHETKKKTDCVCM